MNRVVQWIVVCGVWWCLLVDVLGNYAGQDHAAAWVPIIDGTAGVLVFVHGAATRALIDNPGA
jgi:hypothetical protein